jgi:hypothetical protein
MSAREAASANLEIVSARAFFLKVLTTDDGR